MGLGAYATGTPGLGGRLKLDPEDFRVDEISRYPLPDAQGRYTIARVEVFDIEQNELLGRLQRAFGLRPGSVGFAGSKDRRAVTSQLLSLPVPEEAVRATTLSGVRVLETYRARRELSLGHLYGNRFRITLADVGGDPTTVDAQAQRTAVDLQSQGGFPNYFGPQRFGEVRPITHLVGRALVLESAESAVETYLTGAAPGEVPMGSSARVEYAQHHDPVRALQSYPTSLGFERVLLERLARGDSGERALRALPRHLRLLFVHAYQSYLFNRIMTARLARGLALADPAPGDRLLRLAPDGLDAGLASIPVFKDNLEEARNMVQAGRARVAGPLVGTETPIQEGVPGEIVEGILHEEGVTRSAFHIPQAPELSSQGTFRAFLAPWPFRFLHKARSAEGPTAGRTTVVFEFSLEKGQYATVLLREFQKGGAEAPANPA